MEESYAPPSKKLRQRIEQMAKLGGLDSSPVQLGALASLVAVEGSSELLADLPVTRCVPLDEPQCAQALAAVPISSWLNQGCHASVVCLGLSNALHRDQAITAPGAVVTAPSAGLELLLGLQRPSVLREALQSAFHSRPITGSEGVMQPLDAGASGDLPLAGLALWCCELGDVRPDAARVPGGVGKQGKAHGVAGLEKPAAGVCAGTVTGGACGGAGRWRNLLAEVAQEVAAASHQREQHHQHRQRQPHLQHQKQAASLGLKSGEGPRWNSGPRPAAPGGRGAAGALQQQATGAARSHTGNVPDAVAAALPPPAAEEEPLLDADAMAAAAAAVARGAPLVVESFEQACAALHAAFSRSGLWQLRDWAAQGEAEARAATAAPGADGARSSLQQQASEQAAGSEPSESRPGQDELPLLLPAGHGQPPGQRLQSQPSAHLFVRLGYAQHSSRSSSSSAAHSPAAAADSPHYVTLDLVFTSLGACCYRGGVGSMGSALPSGLASERLGLGCGCELVAELVARQTDDTGVPQPLQSARRSELCRRLAPLLCGNVAPHLMAVLPGEALDAGSPAQGKQHEGATELLRAAVRLITAAETIQTVMVRGDPPPPLPTSTAALRSSAGAGAGATLTSLPTLDPTLLGAQRQLSAHLLANLERTRREAQATREHVYAETCARMAEEARLAAEAEARRQAEQEAAARRTAARAAVAAAEAAAAAEAEAVVEAARARLRKAEQRMLEQEAAARQEAVRRAEEEVAAAVAEATRVEAVVAASAAAAHEAQAKTQAAAGSFAAVSAAAAAAVDAVTAAAALPPAALAAAGPAAADRGGVISAGDFTQPRGYGRVLREQNQSGPQQQPWQHATHLGPQHDQHQQQQATAATSSIFVGGLAKLQKRLEALQRARLAREGGQEGGAGVGTGGGAGHGEACGLGVAASAAATGQGFAALGVSDPSSVVGLDLPGQIPAAGWTHVDALAEARPQVLPAGLLCELEPPAAGPQSHELLPASVAAAAAAAWDEPPQLRHATPVALHAEMQTQPQPMGEAPPVRDAALSAAGSSLRGAQSSESSRVRGDGSGGSGQSPSVASAPRGMWQETAAERANSQAGANREFAQSTSRNSNGVQLVLQARSGGMGTQQAASSVSVHGSAVAHSRPHTNSQAAAVSHRHGTSSELADDTVAARAAAAASAAATAAAKEAETARLHAVAGARAAAAAAQARSQAQAEAEAAAAAERLSQLRSQFDRLYFGLVPEGLRRGEAPLQQQAELQPERPGLGAQQAAPLEQPRGSDLGGGAAPLESGHLQSNLQLPPRERPAAGPAHHIQLASAGMHLRPVDQLQDGAPTAGLTGASSGRAAAHLRMPGPTPGLSGALLVGAEVLGRTSTARATLCLAEPASDVAGAARPEHCRLNSTGAHADASAGKVESLGLAAVCGQQRGHSGGADRAGRPAEVGGGKADEGAGSYAAQYLQHTSMSAQSRWSASYARQQPSDAAGRCAEAWPQESSVLELGAAGLSQGYGSAAGAIHPEAHEMAAGADAAAAIGRLHDQEGARPHRGAGSWGWGEGGDDGDVRVQQPRSEEGWEELAAEPHDPSRSNHDQQGQQQQVPQRQRADEPGHQPAAEDIGGAGDSDGGSRVGESYEDAGGGSDQDTESISLVRRSAHRHSEEDVIERLWPTGGDDDGDGAWAAASRSCSRSLGSRQGRSSEGSRGSARSGSAGSGREAHSGHSRTHTSAAGTSASGGSGGGVYDDEEEVQGSGGGEEAYSHVQSQQIGRSAVSDALQSPSTGSSGRGYPAAVAASVACSHGSRGGGVISSHPTAQPQPRARAKSLGTRDTGATSTALSGGPRFTAASRHALGPDRQQGESRQVEQNFQHMQAQHQHHQHQKQQAEELQRRNAALMGVLERAAAGSDALQAKMYEQRLEVMELQAAMEVERAQHAGEVARLRRQLRHAAEAAVAAEGAAATAAGAAAAAASAAEGATAVAAAANARAAPTSGTEAGKLAIADVSSGGIAVGRRSHKDPQAAAVAARAAGEAAAEASAAALQALLAAYEAHIRDLQKQVESLAAGQSEIAIQAAQQELAGLAVAAAASAKRRRRRHSYGGALSQHGHGAAYNIRSGDVSEEGDTNDGGLMPLPSEGQILRGLRGVSAGCGGGGGGGAFGGSIGAVAKWERGRAELKALRLALRQSQQRESGLAAALTAAQQQQRAALLAARQAAGEGARRRWLEQQVSDLRCELEAERGRTSAVLGERDAAHRDRLRLELENQVLLAQQVELRRMCEAYAALAERSNNYMRMAVALPEAVAAAQQPLMLEPPLPQ